MLRSIVFLTAVAAGAAFAPQLGQIGPMRGRAYSQFTACGLSMAKNAKEGFFSPVSIHCSCVAWTLTHITHRRLPAGREGSSSGA